MNELLTDFIAAWSGRHAATEDGRGDVALDDLPALPLARTVKMPDGHGYESGALSVALRDLVLRDVGRLDATRCALERDGNTVTVTVALPPLHLDGRCVVSAKPDPVVAIDYAGNLADLPPDRLMPIAAGQPPGDPPLDATKEEWLDNARDHREKLAQTENGQKLLSTYSEHNDTYAEVMKTPAFVRVWRRGGVTKEMAADTHAAVKDKNDGVVNSKTKTYTSPLGTATYNGHAFTHQLNLVTQLVLNDPSTHGGTTAPAADSKYAAAAKAALSFGKGVGTSTGNQKNTVNEMRSSQIYSTVDTHSGDVPAVSHEELLHVMNPGSPRPGGRDGGVSAGWIVLDEEDRANVERFKNEFLLDQAADATIVGKPLFEGRCSARLESVTVLVEFALDDHAAAGASTPAVAAETDLPGFDLDIDDADWGSEAGAVARQRLESIHFLRVLLRETIARGLERAVAAAVAATLSDPAGRPV